MPRPPMYVVLAEEISRLTPTVFALMGDGNMHMVCAMAEVGVRIVHTRHEHSAVVAAEGWARQTGTVGVASVTCGPGVTQTATALTAAVRRGEPLVLLAGDVPSHERDHAQRFALRDFVASTGAGYVDGGSDPILGYRTARHLAARERTAVVLRLPMDVLAAPRDPPKDAQTPVPPPIPPVAGSQPGVAETGQVLEHLRRARRPVLLAGRGVLAADRADAVRALADRTGAALATTLEGVGLFAGHPRDLGLAGGFTPQAARPLFAQADLIVALGASLNPHTTDAGALFGRTPVVVLDRAPHAVARGTEEVVLRVAGELDVLIDRLLTRVGPQPSATGWSSETLRRWRASEPDGASASSAPGVVDPRRALLDLDEAVPQDWSIVVGVGHYASVAVTHLRRPAGRLHTNFAFGAVGQALPLALGIAAARGDGRVVLVIGDGGLLMHVQELETVRRQSLSMAIMVCNDGAYGAEVHKLAADGIDPAQARFGVTDLAAVARAFGWRSEVVVHQGQLQGLVSDYRTMPEPTLWDVRVDGTILAERYRRVLGVSGGRDF